MVYQTDSIKGYWYYDGSQWKDINALKNGGGKHTLVLSGDITNAEAQLKIAAEVGTNTQEIRIIGCNTLTQVDVSGITSATQIVIAENSVLQMVTFDNLLSCNGTFFISNCPAVEVIKFPLLKNIANTSLPGIENNSMTITGTAIVDLNFPALKRVSNNIQSNSNNKLKNILFPKLISAGSITINAENVLTSVSFPALTSAGVYLSDNQLIKTISFPALTKAEDINLLNNASLVSISFSTLTQAGNIDLSSNASLASMAFPALSKKGYLNMENNTSLPIISFPSLTQTDKFNITEHPLVSSIDLPMLAISTYIYCYQLTGVTSVSMPAITQLTDPINYSYISKCKNLTSISFNILTNFKNPHIDFSMNKLPSSQVNNLLHVFVSTSPLIYYHDIYLKQTPQAPPTGQGLIDKATLTAGTNFIYTD